MIKNDNLELFEKYESLSLDLEASVWISASAGGGKTSIIIKRILKLIIFSILNPKMFHVEHSKIIILTYTNEAANEIKNRIKKKLYDWQNNKSILEEDIKFFTKNIKLNNDILKQLMNKCSGLFKEHVHLKIKISSFHSFCFNILEKLKLNPQNSQIIDEHQSHIIIKNIINNISIKNSTIQNVPRGTFLKKETKDQEHKMFHVEHFDKDLSNIENNNYSKNKIQNTNISNELLNNKKCSTWNIFKKKIHNFKKTIYYFLQKNNYTNLNNSLAIQNVPRGTFLKNKIEKQNINCSTWNNFIQKNKLHTSLNKGLILSLYKKYKIKHKILDFNDIIEKLNYYILHSDKNEWIMYEINRQIEHIIIDEAQDNSEKQWIFVKKIIQNMLENSEIHKTFLIVGDIKQSIYSFQGATPNLFTKTLNYFKNQFAIYNKKFHYIQWDFSFRVPKNILNFIDRYFEQKNLINDLSLNSLQELKHIGLNNNDGEITTITIKNKNSDQKCSTWNNSSNTNKSNKIILNDKKSSNIKLDLKNKNVPRETFLKKEIKNQECKMFHVEHFEKDLSNIKNNNYSNNKIQNINININNKLLNNKKCSTWNNFKKKIHNFKKTIYYFLQKNNYTNLNNSLAIQNVPRGTFLKNKIEKQNINCSTWNNFDNVKILNNINKLTNYTHSNNFLLQNYYKYKNQFQKNIINKILQIDHLKRHQLFSLKNFQHYINNNIITIQKNSQKNGIKILTIHASKGLEADTVIFINDILKDSKKYSDESARLLYVALTRTKKKLIIFEE